MTDKIHALTVALEVDMRSEDAEPLIAAIRMLRGVISVTTHISEPSLYVIENRVRHNLIEKLLEVMKP